MKNTKSQLKQIVKEELKNIQEMGPTAALPPQKSSGTVLTRREEAQRNLQISIRIQKIKENMEKMVKIYQEALQLLGGETSQVGHTTNANKDVVKSMDLHIAAGHYHRSIDGLYRAIGLASPGLSSESGTRIDPSIADPDRWTAAAGKK